jgi:AbrB family looped-hinge helix DNA binding protein
MSAFSTAKLSSKGQIVIPEDIRNSMGLQVGDQFIVVAEKDVVILKSISRPNMNSYSGLIKKTRKAAKVAGLTKSGLSAVIKESHKK